MEAEGLRRRGKMTRVRAEVWIDFGARLTEQESSRAGLSQRGRSHQMQPSKWTNCSSLSGFESVQQPDLASGALGSSAICAHVTKALVAEIESLVTLSSATAVPIEELCCWLNQHSEEITYRWIWVSVLCDQALGSEFATVLRGNIAPSNNGLPQSVQQQPYMQSH